MSHPSQADDRAQGFLPRIAAVARHAVHGRKPVASLPAPSLHPRVISMVPRDPICRRFPSQWVDPAATTRLASNVSVSPRMEDQTAYCSRPSGLRSSVIR